LPGNCSLYIIGWVDCCGNHRRITGGYLETADVFSNANQTGGSYVLKTYPLTNVASYRGQTIRVNFLATTDSSLATIFRIDDVSLMADGN